MNSIIVTTLYTSLVLFYKQDTISTEAAVAAAAISILNLAVVRFFMKQEL